MREDWGLSRWRQEEDPDGESQGKIKEPMLMLYARNNPAMKHGDCERSEGLV